MSRFAVIGLLVSLALPTAAAAGAAIVVDPPVVPRLVQLQLARKAPALAYTPTRMALGFRYTTWQKTLSAVQITFRNTSDREIRFVVTRLRGMCRTGMEKSFQLAGNKVYWSHEGAEQRAWRCLSGPRGRHIRLVASSQEPPTRFADVGLGRVVASGKRIPA